MSKRERDESSADWEDGYGYGYEQREQHEQQEYDYANGQQGDAEDGNPHPEHDVEDGSQKDGSSGDNHARKKIRTSDGAVTTASGPPSSVAASSDVHASSTVGADEFRFLIDSSSIGALIGKGGSNISLLRQRSGCAATILKNDTLPPHQQASERVLSLKGSIEGLGRAGRIMLEIFATDGGRDGRIGSGEGNDAAECGINEQKDSSLNFLVHKLAVGALIGKGGSLVKALQTETHTRVHVSNEVLGASTDKLVTITGTLRDVHAALLRILQQLHDSPLKAGTKIVHYIPMPGYHALSTHSTPGAHPHHPPSSQQAPAPPTMPGMVPPHPYGAASAAAMTQHMMAASAAATGASGGPGGRPSSSAPPAGTAPGHPPMPIAPVPPMHMPPHPPHGAAPYPYAPYPGYPPPAPYGYPGYPPPPPPPQHHHPGAPPSGWGAPSAPPPAGVPGAASHHHQAAARSGPRDRFADPLCTTQRIAIPSVCSGVVLGHGGSIVRSMAQKSGAKISLAQPDASQPQSERIITIIGRPEQITAAIALIQQQVESYTPGKPPPRAAAV